MLTRGTKCLEEVVVSLGRGEIKSVVVGRGGGLLGIAAFCLHELNGQSEEPARLVSHHF